MIVISCGSCGGLGALLGIRPDGLFQCDECAKLLAPGDIDVDGSEIWAVGPDGTLGYVTDPAVSLAEMAEAIDEYMSVHDDPDAEMEALQTYRYAASALSAAYEAGIPYPHKPRILQEQPLMRTRKPVPTHTILCPSCDGLSPLYAASDAIFACHTCDWYVSMDGVAGMLDEHEIWTVYPTGELGYTENPVIVAAYTVESVRLYLEAEAGSEEEAKEFAFLTMLLSTGCDTASLGIEMPLSARLCCPKCKTGGIAFESRQWAVCVECDWGGLEYEFLYYGDSYQQ